MLAAESTAHLPNVAVESFTGLLVEYAKQKGLALTEFLPEYDRYGRAAPIVRNKQIVDYADAVIAFWDGKSKGTQSVISYAKKIGKECTIILCK